MTVTRFYAGRDGQVVINGETVSNPAFMGLRFTNDKGEPCTQIICDFGSFEDAREMARRLNRALNLPEMD